MNKIAQWALIPFKAMFKKIVRQQIQQEQSKITDLIASKVTLPNMSAAKERELITKLYDTFEEVISEVLNTI